MAVKLSQIVKEGVTLEMLGNLDYSSPEIIEYTRKVNEKQKLLIQLKEKPFKNVYITI